MVFVLILIEKAQHSISAYYVEIDICPLPDLLAHQTLTLEALSGNLSNLKPAIHRVGVHICFGNLWQ